MVDPLIAAESLTVERGGRTILSKLSFALAPGEALLVTGRNGAGKSTLLRALAGLLPAQAGRIQYGLADEETRGVETLHYLGYEDALKPTLTVKENLEFWAAMLGASSVKQASGASRSMAEGRAAPSGHARRTPLPPPVPFPGFTGGTAAHSEALAALGIARLAELPAGYLSAGQKRRVALARLLVVARPIWLLDEPLIALDASAQALLSGLLERHLVAGGAVLVASHQALGLPHRIIDLAERAAA